MTWEKTLIVNWHSPLKNKIVNLGESTAVMKSTELNFKHLQRYLNKFFRVFCFLLSYDCVPCALGQQEESHCLAGETTHWRACFSDIESYTESLFSGMFLWNYI